MLPGATTNDLATAGDSRDGGLGNSERCGDLSLSGARGKQCRCTGLNVGTNTPVAPLSFHVGHVVFVRTQEEMVRAAARRVVTPMADFHAIGDLAVGKGVGDAVSMCPPLAIPDAAVPLSVASRPSPRPATIGGATVNTGPEACRQIGQRASVSASGGTEAARPVRWLPTITRAFKLAGATLARQCDKLRGHRAYSSVSCPRMLQASRGLCVVILP